MVKHFAASTVPMLLALTHCVDPIDAPPAFFSQQYLCDAAHQSEWEARTEQCREAHQRDGSCAGILSFRGTLDSQPMVVGSPVTSATVRRVTLPDGSMPVGSVIRAPAPYFTIQLTFVDNTKPASGNVFGNVTGGVSNSDFIDLEARGGNYLANFVNETRETRLVTSDEANFAFSTDLSRGGGHIDGCLHVFFSAR
jgi:hypothetical protein